jgi:hypothetical protein
MKYFLMLKWFVVILFCAIPIFYALDLWLSSGWQAFKFGWSGRPFVFISLNSIFTFIGYSLIIECAFIWMYCIEGEKKYIVGGFFIGFAFLLYWLGIFTYMFSVVTN